VKKLKSCLSFPVLFIMLFVAAPLMTKASDEAEAVPFELNASLTGTLGNGDKYAGEG